MPDRFTPPPEKDYDTKEPEGTDLREIFSSTGGALPWPEDAQNPAIMHEYINPLSTEEQLEELNSMIDAADYLVSNLWQYKLGGLMNFMLTLRDQIKLRRNATQRALANEQAEDKPPKLPSITP